PAQLALQGADGVGQRGLRDPAALGGTGEVALLAEGQEVADLVHLHVNPNGICIALRRGGCHRGSLSKVKQFTLGKILSKRLKSHGLVGETGASLRLCPRGRRRGSVCDFGGELEHARGWWRRRRRRRRFAVRLGVGAEIAELRV